MGIRFTVLPDTTVIWASFAAFYMVIGLCIIMILLIDTIRCFCVPGFEGVGRKTACQSRNQPPL